LEADLCLARITEGNSIDGNLKRVQLLIFHLATVFAIDAMSLGASDVCLVARLNRASDSWCRRRARMQLCSAWFSRHPRFPRIDVQSSSSAKTARPHAGGRSLDDSSLILSDRRKSSLSAGRHAGFGLERVEVMANALVIGRAVELDGGREVIEREPGVERIDADNEEPRPLRLIVDRGGDVGAGGCFF
jgi:hypothetical protein